MTSWALEKKKMYDKKFGHKNKKAIIPFII